MSKTSEFWNARYSGNIGFEALTTQKPSEAVQRFIAYLQKLHVPVHGSLLDIGCDMGRNASWLSQQGFDVSGVDVSGIAIREARDWAGGIPRSGCLCFPHPGDRRLFIKANGEFVDKPQTSGEHQSEPFFCGCPTG